ncbi:glutamate--cysteine ligase [Allokutzneria multivorans]|uniref:Putative glutamate--cysteine ligase 2 n=1 Tax=Allokutzneria multivorans TaxID=1142134 RepID=A0ABP7SIT9_9PSEU
MTSPGTTLGVEEEFLLVDAETGLPAPGATAVLACAGQGPTSLQRELLSTQVESATGVCETLAQLGDQLSRGRALLASAASANGMLLLSTGTPVLDGGPPPHTVGERFESIMGSYAGVVANYQVGGCHVHVGVPDRDTAIAVINHVRPWLPSLLALSGNSVFAAGRDSGYASWRTMEQTRFPGGGATPWFGSAAEYDAEVARLAECGAIVDEAMCFWLARPSPRFPTVEIRVADAVPTVEEALLQAALTRALVRTALSEVDSGREAVRVPDQVAAAALWTAARHGVTGFAVHPFEHRRVPAASMIADLFKHVRDALADTGDEDFVETTTKAVLREGNGADRQRAAAVDGPRAVIDMLAAAVSR